MSSKPVDKLPRWVQDLFEFAKAFGVFIAFVTGVLLVLLPYSDEIWNLYKGATSNQQVGFVLFVVLAWATGIACYIVFRHGVPHYVSRLRMTGAIREGARRLREYLAKCLHDVEPKWKWRGGVMRRDRSVWRHLAASFVDAYSDECTKLRDHGLEGRPLLPSNFQVYAKCVASLLRSIEGRQATVWTLLRRPIPEWYNLFPVLLDPSNPDSRGVFTTRWWEDYKKDVKSLVDAKSSQITLKRLIAVPPNAKRTLSHYQELTNDKRTDVNDLKSCCVLDCEEAFDLKLRIDPPANGVRLLPEVKVMLEASHNDIPDRARIHLIGTFEGNRPPAAWTEIVEHFERNFHTGSGAHRCADPTDVGGVYYKYLIDSPSILADFDDIFLIESGDMMFGIALCVEEDLDKAGISILRSENAEFTKAFQSAWDSGSNSLTLKYFQDELLYIVTNS